MRHYRREHDAATGAVIGESFTASISERILPRRFPFLEKLILSLKGDLSANATVDIENFLDVLNPFVLKLGGEALYSLRGRDLFALSCFWYGHAPKVFEGGPGEDVKVLGIQVPLLLPYPEDKELTWLATKSAVANVSGERLSLVSVWNDEVKEGGPISVVEIAGTSSGATGYNSLNFIIPQNGELLALLIYQTTNASRTSDTQTLQRLILQIDGKNDSEVNLTDFASLSEFNILEEGSPGFDTLNNYQFIDFRDAPIDARAHRVSFIAETQAVNEPFRFIPVMRLVA